MSIVIVFIIVAFQSINTQVRPSRYKRIQQFVKKNPELEPIFKEMMSDGKLTNAEADELLNFIKK